MSKTTALGACGPALNRSNFSSPPPPPSWHGQLLSIGVTGTNGKTSTAGFVAAAVAQRRPVIRIVTTGAYIGDEKIDVPKNYSGFLQVMRRGWERGARYASVELTSEALFQGMIKAWPCHVGIFTNLTRDHLNWHGSAEHYLASKAQLFMHLPPHGAAVLNACDPASELLNEVVPSQVRRIWYGVPTRGEVPSAVDLAAERVDVSWSGTHLTLRPSKLDGVPSSLTIRAIGEVQGENALAAAAAAAACGIPLAEAFKAISKAPPPPGRFEVVHSEPHVVIDYAHTPDALQRTLHTARHLQPHEITVVFGAGGQRDREKRPLLGQAAAQADRIIITTDNPRDEDPAAIAAAIREGIGSHARVEEIPDRRKAIRAALLDASGDDIVLIAGKGHETHQSVSGAEVPLSDAQVVASMVSK